MLITSMSTNLVQFGFYNFATKIPYQVFNKNPYLDKISEEKIPDEKAAISVLSNRDGGLKSLGLSQIPGYCWH